MNGDKGIITKKFVDIILLREVLCEKLLEIIELSEEKKQMGIPLSKKIEAKFDDLVEKINKCDERQEEVEIALGIDKNNVFILN
jgi:hypothetical protein